MNDVINIAIAQLVNQDMAQKEQGWNTKVKQLDLTNKYLVKKIKMSETKKLQLEDEKRQVIMYIRNYVISPAIIQVVNEDMSTREQRWKTKVHQLDLANKDLVRKIQFSEAKSQILTEKHKSTEETIQQLDLQYQELTNQAEQSKIRIKDLKVINEELINKVAHSKTRVKKRARMPHVEI